MLSNGEIEIGSSTSRGGHSHKRRSHGCNRGQEAVKGCFWCRSRTIFKLGNSGQDINLLRVRIAHSVVKCVRSNGQGPICGAVKRSSNKNDGQNFLTPVAAVTTAPIGVTTPCTCMGLCKHTHLINPM